MRSMIAAGEGEEWDSNIGTQPATQLAFTAFQGCQYCQFQRPPWVQYIQRITAPQVQIVRTASIGPDFSPDSLWSGA